MFSLLRCRWVHRICFIMCPLPTQFLKIFFVSKKYTVNRKEGTKGKHKIRNRARRMGSPRQEARAARWELGADSQESLLVVSLPCTPFWCKLSYNSLSTYHQIASSSIKLPVSPVGNLSRDIINTAQRTKVRKQPSLTPKNSQLNKKVLFQKVFSQDTRTVASKMRPLQYKYLKLTQVKSPWINMKTRNVPYSFFHLSHVTSGCWVPAMWYW